MPFSNICYRRSFSQNILLQIIINNEDMKAHYQIVIIGAGTAGIMTAAQLLKKDKSLDIVIIDPAEMHYYQPAWTLVGAGTYDFAKTAKSMRDLIPKGVEWLQDSVTEFFPEEIGRASCRERV